MAVKRYIAIADNTITNQYNEALQARKTKGNAGQADSLEIFKIYGQVNSDTVEQAKILIKFPVNEENLEEGKKSIYQDRASGSIPASGSVKFYMRLFNVRHPEALPNNYKVVAHPLKRDWDEGYGIDLDEFSDYGQSNWLSASSTTAWATAGAANTTSDVDVTKVYTQTFTTGLEDFKVDVTAFVEGILDESLNSGNNYGLIMQLSSSYLADSNSYYTKKFSARDSEYFLKRPCIEAVWDSSIKDDRKNVYFSSSLCASADNLNTIYLYNNVGGRLKNIPDVGTGSIFVNVYKNFGDSPSGSAMTLVTDGTYVRSGATTVVTGGYVSTGVYSASFAVDELTGPYYIYGTSTKTGTSSGKKGYYYPAYTTEAAAGTSTSYTFEEWPGLTFYITDSSANLAKPTKPYVGYGEYGQPEILHDVWYKSSTQFHTGSFEPKKLKAQESTRTNDYYVSMTNLKPVYYNNETARMRIYTRLKGWSPTIYSRAIAEPELYIPTSGSFEVVRIADNMKIIEHATGSTKYTELSYDGSGSYFDFDMALLEPGYSYGFRLAFYDDFTQSYKQINEVFKFRVEKYES